MADYILYKGDAAGFRFKRITGDFAGVEQAGWNGDDSEGNHWENGCLMTDAPVFPAGGGSGTVTSVGLALPASLFSVSESPVTGTGTLTGTLINQVARKVFMGPDGGADAVPGFRLLVAADVPALAYDPTGSAAAAQAASQPLNSNLTTIAGLTATTDNFMQSKAGAWASRTIAQIKTDLGLPQTTITGNAGTATALATARTINGTPFNGTSDINIGVAALVLTGATLAANVVASSLTSVGTLSALLMTTSDAATNTASDGIVTNHNTSGTPAAGFGTKRKWQLQSNNTTLRDAADITVTWVTATDASRTARSVLNVFDTVTREGLRVEASGTAPMIGFLGANASAALVSPDLGTLATTFGLASGTPTFAGANVTGTVPLATSAVGCTGGSGTTSTLTLKTTTGVGATGADIVFVGGNNGGTEFGRFLNSGFLGIGTAAPVTTIESRKAQGTIVGAISQYGTLHLSDSTALAADVGAVLTLGGQYNSAPIYSAFAAIKGGKSTGINGNADGYLALYTPAVTGILVERGRFDNAGNFGIGTGATTPLSRLNVVNEATGAGRGFTVSQHNAGAQAGLFTLTKSRGTFASPGAIANADFIGAIVFNAHDGTAYGTYAQIDARVNGAVSTGVVPTDIVFSTSATEAMRIANGGLVTLAKGGLTLSAVGSGFSIKEGTNACMGVATLVAGTVTVATTKITATSRVQITVYAPGVAANLGSIYEDSATRVAGTSFSIKSSNVLATPSVNWIIFEPA